MFTRRWGQAEPLQGCVCACAQMCAYICYVCVRACVHVHVWVAQRGLRPSPVLKNLTRGIKMRDITLKSPEGLRY